MEIERHENPLRNEWGAVIQSILDGTASAADYHRLDVALQDNPALRRLYREQVLMDAALDAGAVDRLRQNLAVTAGASSPPRSAFRLPRFVLALAASLLVCLVVAATVAVALSSSSGRAGDSSRAAESIPDSVYGIPSKGAPAAGTSTEGRAQTSGPAFSATLVSAPSQMTSPQSRVAQPEEVSMMNPRTLTNTLAAAASAVALVAMPMTTTAAWTYTTTNAAGTAGTLTDGTWALTATNAGSAVTVTGYTSYSGTGGVLDLSTGLNGGYALTSVGGSAFYSHIAPMGIGTNILPMTSIILPETLVSLQDWAFYSALPTALNPLSNVVVRGSALRSVGTRAFDFWGSNNNDSQRLPLTNDITCLVHPGVTNIGMKAFLALYSICGKLTLTNIQSFGTCSFQGTRLQALDIASPTLTEIPDACFAGDTAITNAVFNVPNLRSFGAWVFGNTNVQMPFFADIAQLCPPGTTNVGEYALAGCPNVHGNLVLTNLVSLGSGGHQFQGPRLTRIDLKGPLQSVPAWSFFPSDSTREVILDCPALTNIGSTAFYATQSYGMGISNLVIGAKGPVVIANGAFDCQYYAQGVPGRVDALTSVTFYGPTPDAASLANLMVRVSTNNSTHTCTIYASAKQAGWLEIAAAPNAAEALNAPKGCFGVYTNGAGRKAWLVNRKSPYDSQVPGFSIRICDNHVGISRDRLPEAAAYRLSVRGRL